MAQQLTFQSLLGASGVSRNLSTPSIAEDSFKREAEREEIAKTAEYQRETYTPHTTGEMFIEGSRAGFAQLMSDVDNVVAIKNILEEDEEEAQNALLRAESNQIQSSNLLEGFGTFEEFLDQPTYESFWEQVVKNVGQFTPMAIASVASGFTGAIAGVAVKGTLRSASKALMKKELERIIKKKHIHEQTKKAAAHAGVNLPKTTAAKALTREEARLLEGVWSYSSAIKAGAITGAFGQEWVMGAGQSLGEYQEAGLELTKKEAGMAAALGIPQAMLGVFAEVTFVGAMARTALRKSGGRVGSRWGKLAKDMAGGFTRSATVESITETGQEGIQIAQRMSVDPEYTRQDALLRLGESAFAGFFAGGARGGLGGTVAGVFGAAKDLATQGLDQKSDIEAGRGPGQDGATVAEPQADIDAQFEAMLDEGTGKDSVWIPNVKGMKGASKKVFNKVKKGLKKAGKTLHSLEHMDGILYSTNKGKLEEFGRKADTNRRGAVDEALMEALGYTDLQSPDHDAVVRVKNKKGRTVWEQTVNSSDEAMVARAMERANELFKSKKYKQDVISPEEVVRERSILIEDEENTFEDTSGDLEGTMAGLAEGEGVSVPVVDYAKDDKGQVINYAPRSETAPQNIEEQVDEATGEITRTLSKNRTDLEAALREDGLVDTNGNLTVDQGLLRSLSDSFIRKYLDLRKADVDKTTVFVPEEKGGRHIIRTETAPESVSRVRSTGPRVEQQLDVNKRGTAAYNARVAARKTLQKRGIEKPKTEQIEAELKKGWGVINKEGNIIYVDMPTLTNLGRQLNQEEGTTTLEDDLGSAAAGFTRIMGEFADLDYIVLHNQTVVEGKNVPSDAVIYSTNAGTTTYTLNDLLKTKEGVQQEGQVEQGRYWHDRFMGYVNRGKYQAFINDLKKRYSSIWAEEAKGNLIDRDNIKDPNPKQIETELNHMINTRIQQINNYIRQFHINELKQSIPELGELTLNEVDGTVNVENEAVLRGVEPTFTRLMVGNHGVYIEFSEPANKGNFVKKRLQYNEYNRDGTKLYDQFKTVNYADYQPGLWYAGIYDYKGWEKIKTPPARRTATAARVDSESTFFDLQTDIESMGPEPGSEAQLRQEATKKAREIAGEKDVVVSNPDEYNTWRINDEYLNTAYTEGSIVRSAEKIDLTRNRTKGIGINKVVLKDKEGFPLTEKYGSMTINNKPAAQVFPGSTILKQLPGLRDFIKVIQKFKFFGLQRNIYLLNQTDVRKGDLVGWIKDLGMNETQAKDFKAAVRGWINTPEMRGKFINVGEVDFILVKTDPNPNSVNALEAYMTLGHEIGHAIYLNEKNGSLGNKKLRSALMKAFNRRKAEVGGQYDGKNGFEEWFADQVSIALMKKAEDIKTVIPGRKTTRTVIVERTAEEKTAAAKIVKEVDNYIPGRSILSRPIKGDPSRRAPYYQYAVPGLVNVPPREKSSVSELKKVTKENNILSKRLKRVRTITRIRQELGFSYEEAVATYNERAKGPITKEIQIEEEIEQKMVDGYFKGIARKIRQLFTQLSRTYQKRFGKQSAVFSEYVNHVTQNFKQYHSDLNSQNRAPPTYSVQVYQRDMVDASLELSKNYFPPHIAVQVRKAAKSILRKGWDGLRYLLYTAHGFLNTLGPAGKEIAAIFYAGSQTGNIEGFLDTRSRRVNEWMNTITEALGLPDSSAPIPQNVLEALLEAENDMISDKNLTPLARKARQVLAKFKKEFIDISDTKVSDLIKEDTEGNQISYFGRRISLTELQGDPNKQALFAKLLVKYTANDEKSAMNFVQELVSKGQIEEEFGFTDTEFGRDLALGMPHAKRRELAAIPTSEMRKIGILEPPEIYLRKYVDTMVKKVEYDKRGGHSRVNDLINEIKNPRDRERARNAVKAMLGKTDGTMPNWYRNTQSVILAWNVVTLLGFAALASLPDLAGPVLRSKDFNSLKYAVKEMIQAATNPAELRALAKDIGVVASESIQTMYINAAELEAMTPGAKKITEGFFKYTGTEWFTNFSRIYATGMSRQFLLHHAQSNTAKSARYLKDLHVSKADIEATFDAEGNPNFDSEAGQRVKNAMGKFVDESIVRPNAAERPVWASDPRLAFLWQLKSFFYAYGKNIVGGAITEGQRSWRAGEGIGGAGTLLVLAGLTMLPLTMVGLELREFLKSGIASVLPGAEGGDRYYQTDKMGWGEYIFEILDRSGVFGPLTMAIPMYQANDYGDQFWVPPLGPSAERVEDLLTKGMGYVVREGVPVYSAIGGIQADR